jgi:hypothetical protein
MGGAIADLREWRDDFAMATPSPARGGPEPTLRTVPAIARWVIGLHLAWGLFAWLAYPKFGDAAAAAQPVLVAAWFGTSMMLMVFGLVVASGGWRPRETLYLALLLIFDLGPIIIAAEQVRIG